MTASNFPNTFRACPLGTERTSSAERRPKDNIPENVSGPLRPLHRCRSLQSVKRCSRLSSRTWRLDDCRTSRRRRKKPPVLDSVSLTKCLWFLQASSCRHVRNDPWSCIERTFRLAQGTQNEHDAILRNNRTWSLVVLLVRFASHSKKMERYEA